MRNLSLNNALLAKNRYASFWVSNAEAESGDKSSSTRDD